MGLFRRPKPKAVAWVWDGDQWIKYSVYDAPADEYFELLMEQWSGCQFLSLTTRQDGCPVLCLDGRP
jgi:hypothetical protein